MILRTAGPHLRALAALYPAVAITGPRQSGKTTLARMMFPDMPYVNLEAPDTRRLAQADPRGFLAQFQDGVVLDEFQRAPELVSYIQVLTDEDPRAGRFILTGSQQFEVMSRVSQSLAGRIGLIRLLPFSFEELRGGGFAAGAAAHWMFSGFYPRIHDRGLPPAQALSDYFATYVQRDVRELLNVADLSLFETFMRLCAGRTGQLLNLSNLAQDLGIAQVTARKWLTVLQASYVVHLTQPYHWRTTKRLMKSPKLYFYDTGLATWLIGVQSPQQLATHPLRGGLFENMVMMDALKFRWHRGLRDNLYFYRDSEGSEIDLVLEFGHGVFPIEIKAGATINTDYFKGIKHFAKLVDNAPNGGGLVYGGNERWRHNGTQIVPFDDLDALLVACGADA